MKTDIFQTYYIIKHMLCDKTLLLEKIHCTMYNIYILCMYHVYIYIYIYVYDIFLYIHIYLHYTISMSEAVNNKI